MKRAFLFATVAIAAILVTGSVVEFRRLTQRAQERNRTPSDVKGIVSDLWCYNDLRKRLPPAVITSADGKPLCSWRFVNAAFLLGDQVQFGFYGQVAHTDKAWNSPENQCYVSGPFREYAGSPLSYIDPSRSGNKARFVAVQGPGTAFETGKARSMGDLPSGMILIVETRGAAVHWMEPGGDLDIRTMPHQIGAVGGIGPVTEERKEFFVGFVDGQVRLVRVTAPFEVLEKFLTIAEAAKHDREAELGPYSVSVWR